MSRISRHVLSFRAMTFSALLNVLQFILRNVSLNYTRVPTPFIWKDTTYLFCRIFAKVRNCILPFVINMLPRPHHKSVICLCLLRSCFTCCLHHLNYCAPYAHFLTSMQDTTFRVPIFTPKQKQSYMELRLSKFYEKYSFEFIGFHLEAIKILYGASAIKVLWNIPLRAIGFPPEANNTLHGASAI